MALIVHVPGETKVTVDCTKNIIPVQSETQKPTQTSTKYSSPGMACRAVMIKNINVTSGSPNKTATDGTNANNGTTTKPQVNLQKNIKDGISKKILRSLFKEQLDLSPNIQFQATFLILSGEQGKRIAKKWFDITRADINFSSNVEQISDEEKNFIAHRWDQSILSLVLKSQGIKNGNLRLISSYKGRRISRIFYFMVPLFTARNRSGTSIIKKVS